MTSYPEYTTAAAEGPKECPRCRIVVARNWVYCPSCGRPLLKVHATNYSEEASGE